MKIDRMRHLLMLTIILSSTLGLFITHTQASGDDIETGAPKSKKRSRDPSFYAPGGKKLKLDPTIHNKPASKPPADPFPFPRNLSKQKRWTTITPETFPTMQGQSSATKRSKSRQKRATPLPNPTESASTHIEPMPHRQTFEATMVLDQKDAFLIAPLYTTKLDEATLGAALKTLWNIRHFCTYHQQILDQNLCFDFYNSGRNITTKSDTDPLMHFKFCFSHSPSPAQKADDFSILLKRINSAIENNLPEDKNDCLKCFYTEAFPSKASTDCVIMEETYSSIHQWFENNKTLDTLGRERILTTEEKEDTSIKNKTTEEIVYALVKNLSPQIYLNDQSKYELANSISNVLIGKSNLTGPITQKDLNYSFALLDLPEINQF